MLGELTSDAIESLLRSEIVARIAYVDRRGFPCIVPITYAYDDRAFYGYSLLGAKIEYMSANPRVCVEVDRVESAADWRSVTARGLFCKLHGEAAIEAVDRISRTGSVGGIAYRIDITQKRGRYSTSDQS